MNARARLARLERAATRRRVTAAARPALYFSGGRLCVSPWAQFDMAEFKKSKAAYDAACKESDEKFQSRGKL